VKTYFEGKSVAENEEGKLLIQ